MLILLLFNFFAGAPARAEAHPITFAGAGGLALHGQISLPAGQGPFPAALLLVGSGVESRYEDVESDTVDGHPTLLFAGLERQLLAKGIAVFLYDKRGVVPEDSTFFRNRVTSDFQTATPANLADDAEAAFRKMKEVPGVDPKRLFVLGHSEGTMLAAQLAERLPEIRGLFLLGMLGRSVKAGNYYQGVSNPLRQFALMDEDHDGRVTQAEYENFVAMDNQLTHGRFSAEHPAWASLRAFDQDGDGALSTQEARYQYERAFRAMVNTVENDSAPWAMRMPRAWFRDYFQMGPWLPRQLPFCRKIHLFQGSADVQTPFEDALALRDECVGQGTPLASVRFYPGLGHAFSPRIGFRQWKDTEGPLDSSVPVDVVAEMLKSIAISE